MGRQVLLRDCVAMIANVVFMENNMTSLSLSPPKGSPTLSAISAGRTLTPEETTHLNSRFRRLSHRFLPRQHAGTADQDDFVNNMWLEFLTRNPKTLENQLKRMTEGSILHYAALTVRSEMFRKANLVPTPRGKDHFPTMPSLEGLQNTASVSDEGRSAQANDDKLQCRDFQNATDPQVGNAVILEFIEGYTQAEAAKAVNLSRPTYIRKRNVAFETFARIAA